MVRGFAVILSVFVMLCPVSLAAQKIESLKAGVVKITAEIEGKTRVGTGFVVNLEQNAAYIVTSSHVIGGASKLHTEFLPRRLRPLKATIIGWEGGDPRGLAALLVEGNIPPGVASLRFDKSATVGGGEKVILIGFPRMGEIPWAVASGMIAGREGRHLIFTGTVEEGNSGGPLIKNDLVVGVITGDIGRYCYALPVGSVQFALKGWGVPFSDVSQPTPPKVKEIARDDPFIAYDNGTVVDTSTGLTWAAKDNGRDVNWQEAREYCENYSGGGYTDWRMPTLDQLESLYDKGKSYQAKQRQYNVHLTGLIELTTCCPWASETRGSEAALFYFLDGDRNWGLQSYSGSSRALPVRGGN